MREMGSDRERTREEREQGKASERVGEEKDKDILTSLFCCAGFCFHRSV